MDGPGLLLHLTPEEVEAWSRTLLRVAGLLGMNQVPPSVSRYNRDHLLAMAYRLDCELVRRAAWDAELAGRPEEPQLHPNDCIWCGRDVSVCGGDCDEFKRQTRSRRMVTLPAEWPES